MPNKSGELVIPSFTQVGGPVVPSKGLKVDILKVALVLKENPQPRLDCNSQPFSSMYLAVLRQMQSHAAYLLLYLPPYVEYSQIIRVD